MAAMAMETKRQSQGKGKPFLEATSGMMTDAYPEAWWSAERLSDGEGLISGQGICGLTLSYSQPVRGVGVLQWWWSRR